MCAQRLAKPSHVPCPSGRDYCAWSGLVVGADGQLYGAPVSGEKVLCVDPHTRDVKYIDVPKRWRDAFFLGIVSAPNGKLYLSPWFDTWDDAESLAAFEGRLQEAGIDLDSADQEEHGGVRGPAPGIWVLSWDPAHKAWSFMFDAESRFSCFPYIAAASNGKLYSPCAKGLCVVVIDPEAGEFEYLRTGEIDSIGTDNLHAWSGIVSASDGRLYCSPGMAKYVLVIDPAFDTTYSIQDRYLFLRAGYVDDDFVVDGGIGQAWGGVAEARDGRLYCCPRNADGVLVICLRSWRLELIPLDVEAAQDDFFRADSWHSIVSASDGRLYCAPYNADSILVIDPLYGSLSYRVLIPWNYHDSYTFKWSGITEAAGRIWCAPHAAATVLTLLLPRPNHQALLRAGQFDTTILTDCGAQIRCHRAVLTSASTVFESMFQSDLKEAQDGTITMSQVSASSVEALVNHMYTGGVPGGENLRELASMADMYGLQVLLSDCLEDLLNHVTTENVAMTTQVLGLHSTSSPEALCIWREHKHMLQNWPRLLNAALDGMTAGRLD